MPADAIAPPESPADEERANAASHGLGAVLLPAALLLVPGSRSAADAAVSAAAEARLGSPALGLAVFGVALCLTYLVSALYHAWPAGPAKARLRRWDHATIFLAIAGSYTPFALDAQRHGAGLQLLGLVWAMALAGMALKLAGRLRRRLLSTALYLAFGWLVAAAARPMLAQLAPDVLALLVAGGLAYSLGSLFFIVDHRLRWGHLIWHLFVIAGSACHALAVLGLAG